MRKLSIEEQIKLLKKLDMVEQEEDDEIILKKLYYTLGWTLKHISLILVSMPERDFEKFKKRFGRGMHHSITRDKQTIGGFAMKFATTAGLYFSSRCLKEEYIPKMYTLSRDIGRIHTYLKRDGNESIYKQYLFLRTKFVFMIVENYGFRFGGKEKQSYDIILSRIPDRYKRYFKEGYAR